MGPEEITSSSNTTFPLTEDDREVLSITDEDFHFQSWSDLQKIIAENNLSVLKRKPSDLKRYMAWSHATKSKYGSIPEYIMQQRLHWTPLPESTTKTGPKFSVKNTTPFADDADYTILPNDWPYGLEPGIHHLVVWTKNRLESEPTRGDVTPNSQRQIEDFVQWKFVDRIAELQKQGIISGSNPKDKVQWFKNWTALQSVPGMEHIHVLLRDIPTDLLLKSWTKGEGPFQEMP